MKYLNRKHISLIKLKYLRLNPLNLKMEKPFVITGMPRSGTKFISDILNKSKKYFVTHDLHVDLGHKFLMTKDSNYLNRLNKRLNVRGYGDVSGVHRAYLLRLATPCKIIIVRNPTDVLVSHLNMDEDTYNQTIERLKDGSFANDFNNILFYVKDKGIPFYKFEEMYRPLK